MDVTYGDDGLRSRYLSRDRGILYRLSYASQRLTVLPYKVAREGFEPPTFWFEAKCSSAELTGRTYVGAETTFHPFTEIGLEWMFDQREPTPGYDPGTSSLPRKYSTD